MWLGAIGGAVIAAFGGTAAVGGLAAMVVGGAIVGAAVGALYQAFTGGNILKGVLYGAIGGAVIGAGAAALGFGSAGSAAGSGAGGAAGSGAGAGATGTAGNTGILGTAESGSTTSLGSYGAVSAKVAPEAAPSLWTTGASYAGAVASLGSAFLKGGAVGENTDKQIAAQEKISREQNAAALQRAELVAAASRSNADLAQKTARERLVFDKNRFEQTFTEQKFQSRETRRLRELARTRNEAGILAASKYVGAKTPTVVQVHQARKKLPFPSWAQQKTTS